MRFGVREFPNVLFEITDTLGQQIGQTMSRDRQFASGFQTLIITGEIRFRAGIRFAQLSKTTQVR
jgi:hypothetical protein